MLTFWRKGFVHTSLDDLVSETGASRSSLYKTFGDKRAMFVHALDLYARRFEEKAADAMASETDARAVLHRLLMASAHRLSDGDTPPGCLRCNSTLEVGGMDPDLDAALASVNARYLDVMKTVLRRGATEGSVSSDRIAPLATFFAGMVAGMVAMAKTGADHATLAEMVETALSVWPAPIQAGQGAAGSSPHRDTNSAL